jgi:hypothetical protein
MRPRSDTHVAVIGIRRTARSPIAEDHVMPRGVRDARRARMMTRVLLLCLGTLVAVGCGGGLGGGGGGDGDECRSGADCDDALDCAGPNGGPVCGIAPNEQCGSNAECGDGSVCHAVFDPCSADFVGAECGTPCTGDPECGTGFVCDGGNCIAQTCDAGFACEAREDCDPDRIASAAPTYDQHHGCFAVACTADADCGARFCVNGTCQDGAGVCVEPIAVP